MAKSLRSKWVRKCKREKRVRYGKKELASLVSLVEKARKNDVVVKDAAEIVREKGVIPIQPTTTPAAAGEDSMEVTTAASPNTTTTTTTEPAESLSLKALIKKTGTKPKWLHPRRLKKSMRVKKKSAKAGSQKFKFKG